jgi:hypothetical protein
MGVTKVHDEERIGYLLFVLREYFIQNIEKEFS